MNFLIVDDDIINQKYLSAILQSYGNIDTVFDGDEAIDLIEKKLNQNISYNAVFLDIMMPKMDGHETLKAIKALEKEYKVEESSFSRIVIMSALSDNTNVSNAFLEGCEYYVIKPINKQNLFELMSEMGFSQL